MRKKKLYLDTSVISYLRQDDAPNEMRDTLEFWDILKMGKYDVHLSQVTVRELAKCAEPKRAELFALLEEIAYTEIEQNEEIVALALDIISMGILPPRSTNDATHIAAAVINGCSIVSWNFNHLVNIRTIDGVRMVSVLHNLPSVDIYSPTMLLERSDSDEK